MKRKTTINSLFMLILIPFLGCSSIEIFKENTEIAPYKAYKSFVIINKEIGHQGFSDPLIDAKVADSLQEKLEALGMVYEREQPELIISYTSNEDPRQKEIYNNRYPMWGWRVWDPWMYDPYFMNRHNPVSTKNYELLQVIVDYIDPKKDKMLMRLTAVSEVNSSKEKTRKALKSVDEVVQTYQAHISKN